MMNETDKDFWDRIAEKAAKSLGAGFEPSEVMKVFEAVLKTLDNVALSDLRKLDNYQYRLCDGYTCQDS